MSAIFSNLVNGFVFSTLLATALWAGLAFAPRRLLNAATRYIIWWVALLCVLLLPAAYVAWKSRPVSSAHPALMAPTVSSTPPSPIRILPGPSFDAAPRVVIPLPIHRPDWIWWLRFLWPTVSGSLLIRLLLSYTLLHRLKQRAIHAPLEVQQQLRIWLAQCDSKRTGIRALVSSEIGTPVAAGPWHPAIILPTRLLEELTPDDLNRIGLHETAHLVRRDDWTLLLQRLLQALFFFHPIVLWMARRIDLEREIACDDMVIAAAGGARRYAACLARIVEFSAGVPSQWPAAYAAEDGSHLLKRVDALLDKTRGAGVALMKFRFAIIAAMLVAAAFAAVRTPAVVAFVPKPIRTQLAKVLNTSILPIPQAAAAPIANAQQPPSDPEGIIFDDSTGAPIASAELKFRQAGMRELAADLETDSQGRFSAPGLPPGDYSVDVVKANFATTSFKLHAPSPRLNLRLVRYGVIQGRVTNTQGKPLPVRLSSTGTGRTSVATRVNLLIKGANADELTVFRQVQLEDDGTYRAFNLPPGEYAIGVWYFGLDEGSGMQLYPDTAHPRFFTVKSGEQYSGIDFIIAPQPSWRISGTVERPAGMKGPVQLALGVPGQPLLPLSMTLDDANGSFHFDKIPAGAYDLFASGPATGYGAFEGILDSEAKHYFGRMRIQVGADIDKLTVPVAEAAGVKVILRADGPDASAAKPPDGCPGTAIIEMRPVEPWAVMMNYQATADFTKPQEITGLAPGRQRAIASQLGDKCFQVNDALVDLSRPATEPVVVKLSSAGSISGTLAPKLSGVRISAMPPLASIDTTRFAYSDQDGHFEIPALRPGRYRLNAANAQSVEVDVKAGAPTPIQLAVNPEGQRP